MNNKDLGAIRVADGLSSAAPMASSPPPKASIPIAEIEAFREAFIACWRAAIAWAYSRQVRGGHTIETMARRVGYSVAKMERLLLVPRDIKLEQISDVCWSMLCEPSLETIDGKIAVCVIPFPGLASAIEAGTGETEGLDPKDESAAPQEDAR